MVKETIFNTLVQVTAKLIGALVSLLVLRHIVAGLGLNEYAIFTLLGSAYLLFDVVADFGTKTIAVREMVVSENPNKTLSNLVGLRTLLACFTFVIGVIFVIQNPVLVNHRMVAIEALLMLFLTSLAGNLEFVCQLRNKMLIKSWVDIAFSLGNLLLLVGPFGQKLIWVYAVYLLSRLISLLLGFKLVLIKIKFNFLDGSELKRLLIAAVPMGLYMLLFTAYDRSVDTWLINHFWGKENVAVYGVAYKIYTNLVLPAYFFMNSVFPHLSSGEEKDKKRIVAKMLPWLMLGCLLIIATTWISSLFIMKIIIPTKAVVASEILNILSLALVFSYINHMLGFFLIAKGQPVRLLFLGAIGLIVNIVCNFILIPKLGAPGGAWATIITEASMCIGLTFLYQSRS